MTVLSILPWKCGGGHVWGEWEPTDRWEIVPFHNSDLQTIRREYERECQRSDCNGSETERRNVATVDPVQFNETIVDVAEECEATYECPQPQCGEHVRLSDIKTSEERQYRGYRITWTCPECRCRTTAWDWERVNQ